MTQRWLALLGLGTIAVGFTVAVVAGLHSGGSEEAALPPPTPTTAPAAPAKTSLPPPRNARVVLTGVSGYDPEGDGREQDDLAALATDGSASTTWRTESYTSFFKNGVGLLLDAGKPVTLTKVVVARATPGVTASLRVGSSPAGPFTAVTQAKRLGASTTFTPRSHRARYLVVWIEDIPGGGAAEIGEVRAWRRVG